MPKDGDILIETMVVDARSYFELGREGMHEGFIKIKGTITNTKTIVFFNGNKASYKGLRSQLMAFVNLRQRHDLFTKYIVSIDYYIKRSNPLLRSSHHPNYQFFRITFTNTSYTSIPINSIFFLSIAMQTWYVNINFAPRDAYLSDIDLLRLMQDKISQGSVSVTLWSEMQESRYCYSIKVTGEFYSPGEIHSAALNKVYLWIRYLASDPLPFFRRDVF
ncbi:uncharacterized protein N7458_004448 [Penicillium daleae]|uniref:Uncharacterized protein n=1 Tax=Penicillium daleae TaxID=63821 RepID=A0AAD6G3F6_9EURO|nr:uncharacterized protein N7458_004448 [Penicillium daleae]KAJ5453492.1 hypothetical protein N7458_004448 [Penicillium daleae]